MLNLQAAAAVSCSVKGSVAVTWNAETSIVPPPASTMTMWLPGCILSVSEAIRQGLHAHGELRLSSLYRHTHASWPRPQIGT